MQLTGDIDADEWGDPVIKERVDSLRPRIVWAALWWVVMLVASITFLPLIVYDYFEQWYMWRRYRRQP